VSPRSAGRACDGAGDTADTIGRSGNGGVDDGAAGRIEVEHVTLDGVEAGFGCR
jgi:hypothetical protein